MTGKFWHSSLAALILAFGLGGAASAQELTLAQCPPAVQAAIRDHGSGGALEEIKMVTREDGTFYVVEIGLGEKRDLKLYITPEGTVVRSRQEIAFNQAPAPVRRTVLGRMTPGASVTDVDVETVGKETSYVVELKVSETLERKITMSPDGTVLSEHEETAR